MFDFIKPIYLFFKYLIIASIWSINNEFEFVSGPKQILKKEISIKFPKITTYRGYNTKYLHGEKSWFVTLTPGASNVNLRYCNLINTESEIHLNVSIFYIKIALIIQNDSPNTLKCVIIWWKSVKYRINHLNIKVSRFYHLLTLILSLKYS